MEYREAIAKALQDNAPLAINMHKIEDHFIMDIDYKTIIDSIIDNLKANGYTITTQQ